MSEKSIKEEVLEQTKAAMRAQEKDKLAVLRLIAAEFKRIEVDERITLDHPRELAVLDKMQKQRRESITQFEAAGRDDLVQKEKFELDVIQTFKPAAFSEAEVQKQIQSAIEQTGAASMQDMGKVMAILKPALQGRADLAQVSITVKTILAGD